jgi:hypothetical protein
MHHTKHHHITLLLSHLLSRRVVALLQQYITLTLYQQQAITSGIEAATRLLGLLETASSQQALLEMSEFYNDAVNEPDFNIKEDYKRWNAVGILFTGGI